MGVAVSRNWEELTDSEKINALRNSLDRLRSEIAEIGADARNAKALSEAVGKAVMALEKKVTRQD
jgi:DNA mismatch repair protein MutH